LTVCGEGLLKFKKQDLTPLRGFANKRG